MTPDTPREQAARIHARVREALEALPADQRQIVLDRLHGREWSRIARDHGVTRDAAQAIFRRALDLIRAALPETPK